MKLAATVLDAPDARELAGWIVGYGLGGGR